MFHRSELEFIMDDRRIHSAQFHGRKHEDEPQNLDQIHLSFLKKISNYQLIWCEGVDRDVYFGQM